MRYRETSVMTSRFYEGLLEKQTFGKEEVLDGDTDCF